MRRKNVEHLPAIRELAPSNTMSQVANMLGLTYNQVSYLAVVNKIRFMKRGQNHYLSVLEESDIPLIKELARDGMAYAEIGRKFDVTGEAIMRVCNGENWKHVK